MLKKGFNVDEDAESNASASRKVTYADEKDEKGVKKMSENDDISRSQETNSDFSPNGDDAHTVDSLSSWQPQKESTGWMSKIEKYW